MGLRRTRRSKEALKRLQDAPKRPQDAPKRPQDDSGTPPGPRRPPKNLDFPEVFEGFCKCEGYRRKRAPRLPTGSRDRPKTPPGPPQDGPRPPQDGPKTAQDGPKTRPRRLQDRPQTDQDRPKHPKTPQDPPRTPPGPPRDPPGTPKIADFRLIWWVDLGKKIVDAKPIWGPMWAGFGHQCGLNSKAIKGQCCTALGPFSSYRFSKVGLGSAGAPKG